MAIRRLGLLVCRSEGPWKIPAEAGRAGFLGAGTRSRQGLRLRSDPGAMIPALVTLPHQISVLAGGQGGSSSPVLERAEVMSPWPGKTQASHMETALGKSLPGPGGWV